MHQCPTDQPTVGCQPASQNGRSRPSGTQVAKQTSHRNQPLAAHRTGTAVFLMAWARSGCRRALPPCGTAPRPPSCSSPTPPSSSPCERSCWCIWMTTKFLKVQVRAAETSVYLAHPKSYWWCLSFLAWWDNADNACWDNADSFGKLMVVLAMLRRPAWTSMDQGGVW